MEELKATCPICMEKRNQRVQLIQADYSENHLECPECGDEFDKPNI